MAGRKGAKAKKTGNKQNRQKKRKLDDPENNQDSPAKESKLGTENIYKAECEEKLISTFGVEFPEDFYLFYEFYINNKDSLTSCLAIQLTGPYDILTGNLEKQANLSKADYHLHGRHFYDTPEMTTVLHASNDDGFHIAYFRDSENELPQVVVSNRAKINGELVVSGDNLFAATYLYCQNCLAKTKDTNKTNQLKRLSSKIEECVNNYGYSLDVNSTKCKSRSKKVVTKSFHKAGLVVPIDKTGVGYRELPETDRDLKKILTKIVSAEDESSRNQAFDELQEIINLVQFANDECDYGMGLELGIDLFTFGHPDLHGTILHLLPLAYRLLGRQLYAEIIEKYLDNRVKEKFINISKIK